MHFSRTVPQFKAVIKMNYPYEETGNRIYMLRKARGLTRERLAEMADISVQFLADIEKGRKNMTITTLRKLSAALMVSTDHIVNGTTDAVSSSDEELLYLFRALPPEKQEQAVKLMKVFAEAVK